MIPGDPSALKITTPGDLEYAGWLLTQAAGRPPARRLPPAIPPSHPAQA